MLRQYLLLIRLDNIFTSSNILADYFVVVVPATTSFDIDIDLKERKQRTLIIAILSLVVGDIFCDYNRCG